MLPKILSDLQGILAQLDNAEERICAAQLHSVMDTLAKKIRVTEPSSLTAQPTAMVTDGEPMLLRP